MKQKTMQTLTTTLSFSGITEDTKSINLPRRDVQRIMVSAVSNIGDSGISSGETFFGALKKFTVGEGANLPLWVERDEASTLIHMMNAGDITGAFQDPLPVNATDSVAVANFEGPFPLSRMAHPQASLTLDVASEFGSATTATIKVKITFFFTDEPVEFGAYYHRVKRASDGTHVIDVGPGILVDALLIGTTNSYLSKITLSAAARDGEEWVKNSSVNAIEVDDFVPPKANWEWWTEQDAASGTVAHYLITGANVPYYVDRELVLQNSTADTLLAFFRNAV